MSSLVSKVFWIMGILSAPWGFAGPKDVFPMKVEQRDFANGLRVLVVPTGFLSAPAIPLTNCI